MELIKVTSYYSQKVRMSSKNHKSLNMTLRYAHLAPSHKVKAVGMLDGETSSTPPRIDQAL